ncbi:hypothetical protein ACFPYJ_05670 [Paenibacillus solisilvae]|uniref:Uncharacterized protein n=1 Tax=Paenibacillus solisilvae TaxID=2486751 RepID=A0ABW0VS70_9BACL
MNPFAAAILLYLLAMVAFMLGSVWLIRTLIRRTVGEKHRVLEHIMDTGSVPEAWVSGRQDNRKAIKRLNQLAIYVRRTRLVDSEATRELLLSKLEQAKSGKGG